LDAEDEVAEVVAFHLDFVCRECDVKRFLVSGGAHEVRGDEMSIWEKVHFAVE
jgi:hypothetical protein